MSVVPVVDIGQHRSRREVGREIDDACRRVGFMQVIGHGVPDTVRDDMLAATSAFFDLPLESKLAVRPPAPEINRGYAARGAEGLAYSVGVVRPPDLFEAFNIGPEAADRFGANIWPSELPLLRPALTAWFSESRRVADRLLDLFAPALGLPDGWFAPFTTHSTDTLRVNHYAMAPGDPDPLDGQLGMGEHTDYGIVTVLYADPVPGLQIIGPDGAWHDVLPEPGALLVNLGDLTATWTNDRWRSTVHRVLPPQRVSDRVVTRRSVAFFHDGNDDAIVECLPTCTDASNPPRYPPITAGEHLMAKLLGPRTLTASNAQQTTGTRLP